MLISVSRRTDIPAFFCEWFINRLREGFCSVKNPFNPKQVTKINLSPENVEAFVFWTRNPDPLIPYLSEISKMGFRFVFLLTITNYPRDLEIATPPLEKALESLNRLAESIGFTKIAWRYDPIIVSDKTNFDWHLENFERIMSNLAQKVDHAIISFVDFYRKTARNLKLVESNGWNFARNPENNDGFAHFVRRLKKIGDLASVPIFSCCESGNLAESGIPPGGCLDSQWLNRVLKLSISSGVDPGQRKFCRCSPSKDIGVCDSCRHGCLYCYATGSFQKACSRPYDPKSELL
ncbi:DUF1848 domain-containing protein [bacterium]|nr:DUF1848 domain-containing protein [bacterium]